LPKITDPNVLVGASNADDAGVLPHYRRDRDGPDRGFFHPIVDDYWFGAIAAQSLSDVYAMGGKPLVALNIAALPAGAEFYEINKKIMQGGIDKMTEAGVFIIGGHTVKDKEPKFGYAVMGNIHPDKILDNAKAQPGDALVLTKPIGTGVISTGIKAGNAASATAEAFTNHGNAQQTGRRSCRGGCQHGYGHHRLRLIGHLNEVLTASSVQRVSTRQVPVFEEAITIAELGMVPGGTRANQKNYDPVVEWSADVTATDRVLLNDAQTSGGLLIFVPRQSKERLIAALQKENILAAHIGDVQDGAGQGPKRIFVEQ
jgi:selenide,water dikinase